MKTSRKGAGLLPNCTLLGAIYFTRNFSEPQNLHFIIKSRFKSRADYNGAHTLDIYLTYIKRLWSIRSQQ